MSCVTQEKAITSFSVRHDPARAQPHRELKASRPACEGICEECANRPSLLRLSSFADSTHFGESGTVREKSSADATRGERA